MVGSQVIRYSTYALRCCRNSSRARCSAMTVPRDAQGVCDSIVARPWISRRTTTSRCAAGEALEHRHQVHPPFDIGARSGNIPPAGCLLHGVQRLCAARVLRLAPAFGGLSDEDAGEPGFHGRFAVEVFESAKGAQQSFLEQVFGISGLKRWVNSQFGRGVGCDGQQVDETPSHRHRLAAPRRVQVRRLKIHLPASQRCVVQGDCLCCQK